MGFFDFDGASVISSKSSHSHRKSSRKTKSSRHRSRSRGSGEGNGTLENIAASVFGGDDYKRNNSSRSSFFGVPNASRSSFFGFSESTPRLLLHLLFPLGEPKRHGDRTY